MRNKLAVLIALVLFMTCFVLPAVAREGGLRFHPGMFAEIAKDANITPDQMKAIMSSWYETEKTVVKLGADLEIKGLDLSNTLESENIDQKAVLDLVQQMGDLETQIEVAEVKHVMKVMSTLTPEQKAKLKAIIQREEMKMMGAGAMMGHGGKACMCSKMGAGKCSCAGKCTCPKCPCSKMSPAQKACPSTKK